MPNHPKIKRNNSERLARSSGRFQSIFEKAQNELVQKVFEAFALKGQHANTYTGQASWFTKRNLAKHLAALDQTVIKYAPELYDAIDEETFKIHSEAVNYVREYSRLNPIEKYDQLTDSELHNGTLQLQRRIIENELTTAFITSKNFAGRMINSWGLDLAKRAAVQEAVTEGMIRGGGSKIIADKVFHALNKTGKFTPQETAVIKGKFIHLNGRNYDLSKYSELVAHVRLSELNNRSTINESIDEGYLCVQIDYHNTTADICRPFEATIWSITGKAVGSYPPLSSCFNGGPPFHPRCSHYVRPIDVEVSGKKARVTDAEFIARKYTPNEAVIKAEGRVRKKLFEAPSFPSVVKLKKLVESKRKSSANHFPGITPKSSGDNKAATAASTKSVGSKSQHKMSIAEYKAKQEAAAKPKKKFPKGFIYTGGRNRPKEVDSFLKEISGKKLNKTHQGITNIASGKQKRIKLTDDVWLERGNERKNYGFDHFVQKHLGNNKEGWITSDEILTMNTYINDNNFVGKSTSKKGKKNQKYQWYNSKGVRFTLITNKKKRNCVVTFYSNRK